MPIPIIYGYSTGSEKLNFHDVFGTRMIDVAIEIPLNGTAPPEMVEVDRPVPLHDTELHL